MLEAGRRPGGGAGRWRRLALLTPLIAGLALPATAGAAAAYAPSERPVTTSYANPLEPVVPTRLVPTGGTVDSCADPTVLRGQDGEQIGGKQVWYMYCTTDPLNDADRGQDGDDPDDLGDLNFRRIPQMVSTDLVNWTYVGEALPRDTTTIPAWIAPDAAFWAPDVVYSSATDRYYLFVTVTETSGAGGIGSESCRGDSAIGVATSASATGPWTFSPTPVVGPRRDPSQPDNPCAYFWTYDPDVLGDTVGATSTFYYGSYYGGVFGAPITFTPAGATAGEGTQVAIGNRYEGANVVQRGGYYYLFASAANCCNTSLTGYSVFAGRSRSPLGPFVDREGNSFLAGRVGGTPVISMNGNRWVGTGHNTVFQDAGGQWWTVYHAVDKEDPIFTGAFTKRPALLDPIDWIDGWPTVRGGKWASDGRMPAPAAQEGERTRYRTQVVAPQRLGARITSASDEFNGSALGRAWTWVRPPAASTYRVSGGQLHWQTQAADLFEDSNSASVLTRSAPRGDYVVETRVRLNVPAEGCCFNYVQAGMVIYGGDDRFIKLSHTSIWETRQTEFAKEVPAGTEPTRYGNSVVGAPAEWTYLRIVVDRLNDRERRVAGGDTESYTSYTSQDGRTWVRGGTWTHTLGAARIGLTSMGGSGFTADFDYVRTYELKNGPHRFWWLRHR
ncbi:MAG: GH43_3 / GH43 / GH43_5 / GH43_4 / GH43 _6 / GH43_30 / GH43_8 / GH43_31 / GH43_34 / GH43 _33 / GH43_13 / GH43_9 [uncultured Frankineae bacterium]|uniref:GH43_3 / GH43 / GH43_5 / GH43_4 / GH43 _6 / GH43_30 / GH43_8 / GH43_31 / GH43_34 / GH43 _33 / GH43_13 / GH43_9 n=1 Tax=uncultured Frankineae bacterium TaxID=437475 RepID=A0A6J4KY50_9ACTN|nr:MAG: GH43_3 / GH43 / GH43_5 / GH43_4 / GH43 _6 / GH43_30 / GH43_8 / GH43_31 / GH43_34 / GH43 _33 / GH43_13 / GH43_9 [uncultured Frankineae bacterium]